MTPCQHPLTSGGLHLRGRRRAPQGWVRPNGPVEGNNSTWQVRPSSPPTCHTISIKLSRQCGAVLSKIGVGRSRGGGESCRRGCVHSPTQRAGGSGLQGMEGGAGDAGGLCWCRVVFAGAPLEPSPPLDLLQRPHQHALRSVLEVSQSEWGWSGARQIHSEVPILWPPLAPLPFPRLAQRRRAGRLRARRAARRRSCDRCGVPVARGESHRALRERIE